MELANGFSGLMTKYRMSRAPRFSEVRIGPANGPVGLYIKLLYVYAHGLIGV